MGRSSSSSTRTSRFSLEAQGGRCTVGLQSSDRPMEYIFILAPDDVSLWSSERIAGSLLGGSAGLSIFVQSELTRRDGSLVLVCPTTEVKSQEGEREAVVEDKEQRKTEQTQDGVGPEPPVEFENDMVERRFVAGAGTEFHIVVIKPGNWHGDIRPSIPIFRSQIYGVLFSQLQHHRALWLFAARGEAYERAKTLVALDMAARGLRVAAVEAVKDGITVISAEASLEQVDFAETAEMVGWRARDEDEAMYFQRLGATCRRMVHRHDAAKEGGGAEGGGAKPLQPAGLRVFEFFSGIGGMRLALPSQVHGYPIKHVTAFDCSPVANAVYSHNFPDGPLGTDSGLDQAEGELRNVVIDGLKLSDVDGLADIWTMSPPCQPYTTTRMARRLDHKDARSKPLYHLMHLLRTMRERPRWIVLENVQGFVGSKVLGDFKSTLRECGYHWRQYLLSPIEAVGLPNHRMRYYLTAEHVEESARRSGVPPQPSVPTARHEDGEEDAILRAFPPEIRCRYPSSPPPVSSFLSRDLEPSRRSQLMLSRDLLDKPWAATRLSIIGPHDRETYCFSKAYSRIVDRSAGSCLLEDAAGPLSDPAYAIDRSQPLTGLYDRVRLFDPDEILALSGFPNTFSWPRDMSLEKRWACIGNSINVAVVRGVMATLFEGPAFNTGAPV